MLFGTTIFPVLKQFLKIPFHHTCLFHAQLSCVAKKQLVYNHKITAHLATLSFFFFLFFQSFFILDISKPCFPKMQNRERPEANYFFT